MSFACGRDGWMWLGGNVIRWRSINLGKCCDPWEAINRIGALHESVEPIFMLQRRHLYWKSLLRRGISIIITNSIVLIVKYSGDFPNDHSPCPIVHWGIRRLPPLYKQNLRNQYSNRIKDDDDGRWVVKVNQNKTLNSAQYETTYSHAKIMEN